MFEDGNLELKRFAIRIQS